MTYTTATYLSRIKEIHAALDFPQSYVEERNLPLHIEACDLVEIVNNSADKIYRLTPPAAHAWQEMEKAAKLAGISLIVVSAFRSVEHQRALIEKKLEKGQNILDVLTLLAPPGYSEHHTGTAIDLTTENCPPCVERFEETDAFNWLCENARYYGFSMSYPRDNHYGFVYEPWHWAYRG